MHCSRSLEIERFAAGFAIAFQFLGERLARGRKRREYAACLHIVFFFRAPRETGRQAHLHLRINASRKLRVAADLDLAAPYFEEIEKALRKCLRTLPRSKRAEIKSAIPGDPPRHITPRVFVAQIHFQHSRRTQAQQVLITLRKSSASTRVQS